jgi:hypothetical protein
VALGLVAVIVIIILIVNRPGPADPGPKTGSTSPAASGTPTPGVTNSSDLPACDPAKVTLEAGTDSTSYEAGINPVLSFTVKSLVDCTLEAGSDVQEFKITSGDELIWSSKDCQESPVKATTVLKAGVPKAGPSLTWDRTRSSVDTCTTPRDPVIAEGSSYHLTVVVGGITSSNDRQFLLY